MGLGPHPTPADRPCLRACARACTQVKVLLAAGAKVNQQVEGKWSPSPFAIDTTYGAPGEGGRAFWFCARCFLVLCADSWLVVTCR